MKRLLDTILNKNGGAAEAVRYIIVGGLTTLFSLAVYYLLYDVVGWSVTLSNVISVVAGILFAYVANKLAVFHARGVGGRALAEEFLKFVSGRALMMVVEVGGVFLLVDILRMHPMAGKVITQIIVWFGNYFISKYVVFRREKRSE